MEATKDESPLQTATVTSQQNIDDVIPETQDAELEIIQVTMVNLHFNLL